MKNKLKLLALSFSAILILTSVAGCAGEPVISDTGGPTPGVTDGEAPETPEISFPEIVETDYNAVESAFPQEFTLPFEPSESYSGRQMTSGAAPVVNLPKLKEWVKQLEAAGWLIESEHQLGLEYSSVLARGEEKVYVDAILSEESPFTSVMLVKGE